MSEDGLDQGSVADADLLAGLSADELAHLWRRMRRRAVNAGYQVMVQGSLGDTLYLIYEGALEVYLRGGAGQEVQIAVLDRTGDSVGEMSLVDPGPRSASVRAVRHTVLLELRPPDLESLFADYPDARVVILRNIARVLARRLRQADACLAAGAAD